MSMSGGAFEDCFTPAQLAEGHSLISQLVGQHVTVAASSGDSGVADQRCGAPPSAQIPKRGVQYPASDPLVLAVGGTTLVANPRTGSYITETAWDGPDYGSSGGFSSVIARPSYQNGVPGIGPHRGVPDVAADADASSGMALIGEWPGGPLMAPAAGTSAGAPFWAGIVALADQNAGRDLGSVNPAIYEIAQSASYHAAFHDVVKGDNTVVVGGRRSRATRRGPAGARSRAGGHQTPQCWCPCWHTMTAPEPKATYRTAALFVERAQTPRLDAKLPQEHVGEVSCAGAHPAFSSLKTLRR